MNNSKILLIAIFCVLGPTVFAQNTQIKKADKLYKLSQYAGAIELYEAGLKDSESLSAKTKLAYCYRMTNRMDAAEKAYGEIVQNERARAITRFYYAETLMANQKYDEAKAWFLQYAELNPKDDKGAKMARACDEVKLLRPVYKKVDIRAFGHNSETDDSAPVYFKNGIVFSSDRKSGINPLKQKSGWTGRDYLQIYFSKKGETGTFQKPGSFSGKLNDLNKHCGPVSFNAGLTKAVFTRTGTQPGRGNTYNMQLYGAESNDGAKWKKVKILDFSRKEHNYMHPALSPDGKLLFFVSDKPGGEGGTDIYKSEWTSKGWSRPLNLGLNVNTEANEGFPFVGTDGKLYFCSKGHTGYGGFDIFMTEQNKKGLWAKPVNIGMPINSSYDDISFHFNENGLEGMFSSNRDGGDDDIFLFDILEKSDESEESGISKPELAIEEQPAPESKVIKVDEEALIPAKPQPEEVVAAEPEPDTVEEQAIPKPEAVQDFGEALSPSTPQLEEVAEAEPELEDFGSQLETEEDPVSIAAPSKKITQQPTMKESGDLPQTDLPSETSALVKDQAKQQEATMQQAQSVATTDPPATQKINTSEIIDSEIEYDVKTPYKGSNVQIIPDETFTSKGASSNEILDEQKPVLNPVTTEKPTSRMAPEMMDTRPEPTIYPMVQMNFLLKKGAPVKGKAFRINGLEFPKGEFIVTPEATLQLNRLVDILKQHPDLKVEIAAFTSSVGDDLENLELSRARAGAIMAQLINQGIAKERLSANGYGERFLLNRCANGASCSPEEHKINERVEAKVF